VMPQNGLTHGRAFRSATARWRILLVLAIATSVPGAPMRSRWPVLLNPRQPNLARDAERIWRQGGHRKVAAELLDDGEIRVH
jgi:hypothetical protein